jgi:hypothetical protein
MEEKLTFSEKFNRSQEKSVLITTFHLIEENPLLNFIYDIQTEVFSQESFEDIQELDSEMAKNIVSIITQYNVKFEEQNKSKTNYLEKLDLSKKHMTSLRKALDPFISEIIREQEKISTNRLQEALTQIDEYIKGKENEFFIIVFPEAFFNYHQNPKGFGNFIPFSDNNSWDKTFTEWSLKHSNTLLIPNVIYIDKTLKREAYKENFECFIKTSYKQENILSLYDHYVDAIDINNIINESHAYFNGESLYRYQKRFILDEDIPLGKDNNGNLYLGSGKYLYIPGAENQRCSNLFEIQICQDHMNVTPSLNSMFFILQSASISFAYRKFKGVEEEFVKQDNLYIHADIFTTNCSVMKFPYGEKTPQLLEATDGEFNFLKDIIKIKCYNITQVIKKNVEEQS